MRNMSESGGSAEFSPQAFETVDKPQEKGYDGTNSFKKEGPLCGGT